MIEVLTHNPQESDGVWDNDVVLLRLDRDAEVQPLWVSPDERVAVGGTPLTLHGYGHTVNGGDSSDVGTLYKTRPGTNSAWLGCWAATMGRICTQGAYDSFGAGGDSGEPWTTTVAGNPLLVMVSPGTPMEPSTGKVWRTPTFGGGFVPLRESRTPYRALRSMTCPPERAG